MSIPKHFVDDLRTRLPVSDVVGKSVKLTRAGREYKGCCPFHHEKTPSFTVNDQKGFYHCFGCGAHGDIVNFVMQNNNLSFVDAVESLAAQAGMRVPETKPQDRERYDKEKIAFHIMEEAAKWFEDSLWNEPNKSTLTYLLKRGLSESTIRNFRIGFAPDQGTDFVDAMKQKNFAVPMLEELGLVRRGKKNPDDLFPFFRGRVIFPVTNRQGRVVAFGGRILPQYDRQNGDFKPPKYLNSPDHFLFHKGQLLYGLALAAEAGANNKPIILAEGYMDVIALHQGGFSGAVAPLGTALTEQQIDLLWRISPYENKNPYLCFDGDEAGLRAAYRALERTLPLLKPDHSLQYVFLPQGADPDSLIKEEGSIAFQKLLNQASPLFEVLWRKETEGLSLTTPEAKAGLKNRLEEQAKTINDRTVQSFYFRAINDRFYQNVVKNQKNNSKNRITMPSASLEALKAPQRRIRAQAVQERILLATLINHPHLYNEYGERFAMLDFTQKELDEFRQILVQILSNMAETPNAEKLKDSLVAAGYKKTLEDIVGKNTLLHASFAAIDAQDEDVINGWTNTLELMKTGVSY